MILHELLKNPEALLTLEPEELAGFVLQHLNSVNTLDVNKHNFFLIPEVQRHPPQIREAITRALMEAWIWLEREGMLAPRPSDPGSTYFITRRGQRMKSAEDVEAHRRSNVLPKSLLHPVLLPLVWVDFLRGEYDIAVFRAFREVEIHVRSAGGYRDDEFGLDLMRKAFKRQDGPLTDASVPKAEQEALCT